MASSIVSRGNTMTPPSLLENLRHAGSWEVSPLNHQTGNTIPDLSPVQPLTTSDIKEKAEGGVPAPAEGVAFDRNRWTGTDLLAYTLTYFT